MGIISCLRRLLGGRLPPHLRATLDPALLDEAAPRAQEETPPLGEASALLDPSLHDQESQDDDFSWYDDL